eukprot:5549182-Alexandrium_andersonii.AAC.1
MFNRRASKRIFYALSRHLRLFLSSPSDSARKMAPNAPTERVWGVVEGHLRPGALWATCQPIGRWSSPATSRARVRKPMCLA